MESCDMSSLPVDSVPQTETSFSPPPPATPEEPKRRKRSGGPRTFGGKRRSSLNALKHGAYVTARSYVASVWHNLKDLGEDPKEFAHMLGLLIKAHRPANEAQMMLVEEIASLRWQRRRNERAQAGAMMLNLDRMENERGRRAWEIDRQPESNAKRDDVVEVGLLATEDCPTKFIEAVRWIAMVRQSVEQFDFDQAATTLRLLYGRNPAVRGTSVIEFCSILAKRQDAEGDEAVSRDSDEYKEILRYLAEEESEVLAAYVLYRRENVDVTRAMREEALAPADGEKWRLLIRQLMVLDRQIERKTRLLLAMQEVDRKAEERLREQAEAMMKRLDPEEPRTRRGGAEGL